MTALIGVPLILMLLLGAGVEGVAFLAWGISMGMLFEYSKMYFTLEDAFLKTALLLVFNTVVHGLNYWLTVGLNNGFLGLGPFLLFFVSFLFLVPRLLHYGGKEALNSELGESLLRRHVQELMAMMLGWIYAGWIPLLMVSIRTTSSGKFWLVLALLMVWACDTFAYFAGRFFGKRLLFETISPKKTWEGLIGGFLGAVIVALIFAHRFLPNESAFEITVLALGISVASALGDLCESMLKRAAQVKDSSNLLPGHGGFLDRFDGVIFALPVMYAFLWLFF